MRRTSLILTVAILGCAGSTEPKQPHVTTVFNFLATPVKTAAGGVPYGTIQSNDNTVLTIPADVSSLTIAPNKQTFSDGTPIGDDMAAFLVPLNGPNVLVDVSNVIDGQAFIAPNVYNSSGVQVEVAIVDGSTVRCLVTLAPNSSFFGVQLGYYRLTSTLAMRIYKAGSNCTGSFRTWTNALLSSFDTKSGIVHLTADIAP